MRVAVLSDIHLGRGDRTDRFGHRPEQFHRFLDFLEDRADEVVLLGDTVDSHHGRVPLAFFREIRIICDVHRGIADRLLGSRYRVISGNHDSCLRRLPGVREECSFDADGTRVVMLHGHQFDRLISASPALCALGNYLGGTAERYGLPGALTALDWIDDVANGVTVDRSLLYRRHAIRTAGERGADVIVLGHLHSQDQHEEDGITYLNTGACLEGRFEYVFIDTSNRVAEALTW